MSQFANQGVVTQISAKPWPDSKTGRTVTLYSFQIDSSRRWFRTGTTPPGVGQGDAISFAADDKGNVQPASIQKVAGNPTPAPAPAASPAAPEPATSTRKSSSSAQSRDGYWSEKEQRDLEKDARYQAVDVPRMSFSAAQERAVTLVAAALAHDVLSFGTTKKGDKLDLLLEYVDQVTDRFFLQSISAPERLASLKADAAPASVAVAPAEVEDPTYE